jgi:hypothetical protein
MGARGDLWELSFPNAVSTQQVSSGPSPSPVCVSRGLNPQKD